MSFTNRINVIVDIATQNASKSLKSLRSDIANADGATGKFKVGMKGAGDFLKQNMAAGALAAGTALVAFGVKAVGAFTDTAKAAVDLGAATGLAVEDASRWIALGDDVEVTAEQLTTSIGRIAKELDNSKWAEYGIETRDAGGNARGTNDILLDTLDMLGRTTNETERARIGNDLFGRGYKNLAPLVGKTRDEYEGMLAAVEDGQVITGAEAKKAERMRLAQDALADALGDVTLAVGALVAEFAPAIEVIAKGVTIISEAAGQSAATSDEVERMVREFGNLPAPVDKVVAALQGLADEYGLADSALLTYAESAGLSTEVQTALKAAIEAAAAAAEVEAKAAAEASGELDHLGRTTEEATQAFESNERAAKDVQKAIEDYRDEIEELYDVQRSLIDAGYDYEESLRDVWDALVAVGEEPTDEHLRDTRDAIIGASEAFVGMEGASLNSKEGTKLQIQELERLSKDLEPGSPLRTMIDEYIAALKRIPSSIVTKIEAQGRNSRVGVTSTNIPQFDTGGVVPGPRGAAQLVVAHGGETILPTHKTGAAGGGVVNITVNAKHMQAWELARELEYLSRRGMLPSPGGR